MLPFRVIQIEQHPVFRQNVVSQPSFSLNANSQNQIAEFQTSYHSAVLRALAFKTQAARLKKKRQFCKGVSPRLTGTGLKTDD
jgi:hypothetical protein